MLEEKFPPTLDTRPIVSLDHTLNPAAAYNAGPPGKHGCALPSGDKKNSMRSGPAIRNVGIPLDIGILPKGKVKSISVAAMNLPPIANQRYNVRAVADPSASRVSSGEAVLLPEGPIISS